MTKNKLELTWYNKDKSLYYDMKEGKYIWVDKNDPRVAEPRILIEKKHYGDPKAENLLIKGDNLLALKALQPEFTEKIKLIYIDPPFNTGTAFEHYDDGLEHSIWLTMMRDRLMLLKDLLREDGVVFVHIDDNEFAGLKVIMDEIFGYKNFLTIIVWQKAYSPVNLRKNFSNIHDYIIVYAKSLQNVKLNLLPRTIEQDKRYKNPDNDPRGPWKPSDLSVGPVVEEKVYPIVTPSGRKVIPPKGRCWVYTKDRFKELLKDNRIWFGKSGNNVPSVKKFLSEVQQGTVPKSLWLRDEVGDNQDGKREIKELFKTVPDVFTTPKPEKLIKRIIEIGTNKDDWILDSFAGSGTTGAVAHKMGRKWIMIELGDHAETLCLRRIKGIVEGKDKIGITKEAGWKKGGGFTYYVLGESLFDFDKQLKFPFINTAYTNGPLIRAVCKMDGFRVISTKGPLHGQVNKRYAHITEQFVNQAYIEELEKEITTDESLVVYCFKHDSKIKEPENISIKRMPMALAKKFVMSG